MAINAPTPLAISSSAQKESLTPAAPTDSSNSQDAGWMAKIRQEVYKNPKVEEVYATIGDDLLVDYWIIIARRDVGLIRELIKDQQENVLDLFSSTENPPFQIDFHIYYREGRDARDLVPDKAIKIPNF